MTREGRGDWLVDEYGREGFVSVIFIMCCKRFHWCSEGVGVGSNGELRNIEICLLRSREIGGGTSLEHISFTPSRVCKEPQGKNLGA